MSQGPDPCRDVAIVGYGPVGCSLAILLAQMGRSVTVLERWPAPYHRPRAVHFDHEVGRILQGCGIGDALRTISEPADVYEWRNAAGRTLLRFGQTGNSPSGWPASSMFNQPALEELLDARARQLGVDVRRGTEASDVVQRDDRAVVVGADGAQVSARYVVGCDGANSTVRTRAELPVTDLGYFYDWLIVDVVLHQPREFNPINLQICDPARPTTVVSGGPGRRRWEFMRLPRESLEDLNAEARAWELLEPWHVDPTNARLERHAVYTFNARYAERWRLSRVFLAGDAAHLMPPFAGQGMCSGLRDAANLAWKLDLVLAGAAAESLLDTYEAERLPSARAAIDLSIELGKVICVPDPARAATRDATMASAVADQPTAAPGLPAIEAGFVHPTSPHAGSQFVQGHQGGRRFDEVYGNGWRLVSLGAGIADIGREELDWFESIGGHIVSLTDPDPLFSEWFSQRDVTWALQRPDFYLYGTAPGGSEATSLLTDLRHHLTLGAAP
jgi:flavoprotein hydroxylase